MPYKDIDKRNAWNKAWRERNPDYAKNYYQKNREHLTFASRQYQAVAMGLTPKDNFKRPSVSKRKIYQEAKARPCTDCGVQFAFCAMDFDHVRGPKLFDVSLNSGYTHEQLLAEIEKCEVVCSNCHRVRTAKRKGPRKPHRVPLIEMRKLFIEQSKNVPCTDCGGSFHLFAMEFCNVRGEKKFPMFQACYKDIYEIIEEMKKCEIVCSNCNRVRARNRRLKQKSPSEKV